MSRILLVCLLAFAAAVKQGADADAAMAADADATGTGYEEPPTTYAAPATAYGTSVAYAEAPKVSSICYTAQCDRHAPCYNFATGTCSPKACDGDYATPAAFVAPAAYADAPTRGGYRRLQNFDPRWNDGHGLRCGCPAGTHDTKDWSMRRQTVLWVGFGFLFAPALCFLWMSFQKMIDDTAAGKGKGTPKANPLATEATTVRINAGIVNMVASLAYLTMATKHGFVTRCNGRDFFYARYVDWIITTPLMLYDLAVLGGSDFNTKLFLCGIDIFMIVSGLIGSLVEDSGAGFGGTSEKWAFFGFSMLAFIPVLWYLCAMTGDGTVKPFSELCNISLQICASSGNDRRQKAYRRAMNLTVLTWICYPIIWICAEGTETISVEGENIAYTVLDILSKSLFGWILVFSPWHIVTPVGPGALVVGSSML